MRGSQCDNCRVFAPGQTVGWLTITVAKEDSGSRSVLYIGPTPDTLGTFCSARCAAEFLYVSAEVK